MYKATFLEKVDRYMDDEMNENEIREFQDILEANSKYQVMYEEHKALRNQIQTVGRSDLETRLGKIREELDVAKKPFSEKSRIWKFIPYGIAASILILAASIFLTNKPIDTTGGEISNQSNIILEPVWKGEVEVNILPEEGKFGAGSKMIRQVEIYKSDSEYYLEDNFGIHVYINYNYEIRHISLNVKENQIILQLNDDQESKSIEKRSFEKN